MDDYYRVLGVRNNASKEEIKGAFRELAKKHHPDKHSNSSKAVRDGATVRFKKISEAYDVLVDDRKRSDYNSNNFRYANARNSSGFRYASYGETGSRYKNDYGGHGYGRSKHARGFVPKLEIALRFLTTRSFFLNATFAGGLLGGAVCVEMIGETLWKMKNNGKSFEEAMESIKKAEDS